MESKRQTNIYEMDTGSSGISKVFLFGILIRYSGDIPIFISSLPFSLLYDLMVIELPNSS